VILRRLILPTLLCALALTGCAGFPARSPVTPTPRATVADQTALDEKVLLGLEASYKAARLTAEAALDARLVSPALARRLRVANQRANAVLVRARAAYDTANARSFAAALFEAQPLVADFLKLVQTKENSSGR
jgi:hypothetical protein